MRHLWALDVDIVVGGDFYGWQATLIAGFNGTLIILAFVTVLYVLPAFSVAEMAAVLRTSGGPYVFKLRENGPRAAFFAGLTEALKVVATISSCFYTIYVYLDELFGLGSQYMPLCVSFPPCCSWA